MTILVMSLKIENRKLLVKVLAWSLAAIAILAVVLRIEFFELEYYGSKEGSERAVVAEPVDVGAVEIEELIEEIPTSTEVREYVVAADRPRYLSIEKLGVNNARVLPMDVKSNGELDTPRNIFDVGWYIKSGKPGSGGTLVIDGHNGGPNISGVFKKLPNLVTGDIIKIERGDGVVYRYKVVENKSVLLSEADAYMSTAFKSPEAGKESVTLITCTGEWSQRLGTYLSRQFTRAVLVEG